MYKQNPLNGLINLIFILHVITSVVSDRLNLEENNNSFVRNLVKKKHVGAYSPPKLNKLLVTTFKPMIIPKFNYNSNSKESQWIPGMDQIQIESQTQSQPNNNPNNYRDQIYASTNLPRLPFVRSGYDLTTLMIVSLVSAFLGALTFSVVDGGQRSIGTMSSFSSLLNVLDVETVAKVFTTLGDWEEKLSSFSTINEGKVFNNSVQTNNTTSRGRRTTRETKTVKSSTFFKWFIAYKKDPVELRCIQKLLCETLATSSCARSINTDVGGSVMNILKYFVTSANDLSDMMTDTMRNPNKCLEIAPHNFCNNEPSSPPPQTTSAPETTPEINSHPTLNLTSITPRLRHI